MIGVLRLLSNNNVVHITYHIYIIFFDLAESESHMKKKLDG